MQDIPPMRNQNQKKDKNLTQLETIFSTFKMALCIAACINTRMWWYLWCHSLKFKFLILQNIMHNLQLLFACLCVILFPCDLINFALHAILSVSNQSVLIKLLFVCLCVTLFPMKMSYFECADIPSVSNPKLIVTEVKIDILSVSNTIKNSTTEQCQYHNQNKVAPLAPLKFQQIITIKN